MIDYGESPQSDVVEVTLFGPGYGEAVAVHLGEGRWMLVDSCKSPDSRLPASAAYLENIGVDQAQVKLIVASHWHDDHVKGMSGLVTKYSDAEFFISSAFNKPEACALVAAYGGSQSTGLTRGTKELYAAVVSKDAGSVNPTQNRTIVYSGSLNGREVDVVALSPLPSAVLHSVAQMAQHLPCSGDSIRHIPELKPNYEAIALHIDLGGDAVLLGADLEEHEKLGWSAVVRNTWSGARSPASVYKVAHHGSITGECHDVWETLLQEDPQACVTPFINGKVRLPTDDDKVRLRERAGNSYISSGGSRKPEMDSRQAKRLGDICKGLAKVDTRFGAVRLRKKIDSQEWNVELFGAAQAL